MNNKALDNKIFVVTDEIIGIIEDNIATYKSGGNTEGIERAKNIVKNPRIKYNAMNRMVNWFKTHAPGDAGYDLIGGDKMKDWVTKTMERATANIEMGKMVHRLTDAPGNSEQKEGGTKDTSKNPTKVNIPKMHKGSRATYVSGDETTYEQEIKSIQSLIEYIDNNKKIL